MSCQRSSTGLCNMPANDDAALSAARTDCVELADEVEGTVNAIIAALQCLLKGDAVKERECSDVHRTVDMLVGSVIVTEYLSHFSYGLTSGEGRYIIYTFLKANHMSVSRAVEDLMRAAEFRKKHNLDKVALFPSLISVSGFDQSSICEELCIPFIHKLYSGKRYVDAEGCLRLEKEEMDYYNVQYADIYANLAGTADQSLAMSPSTPDALRDTVVSAEANIKWGNGTRHRDPVRATGENLETRQESVPTVCSNDVNTRGKDSSTGDTKTNGESVAGSTGGWRSFFPVHLFGHAKEKDKCGTTGHHSRSTSYGSRSLHGRRRSLFQSALSLSEGSQSNSSSSDDNLANGRSTTVESAVLLNPAATGEALTGSPCPRYADSLNFHGILGPVVAVVTKHVPFAFHYWDREGHPIMYLRLGGLNSKQLMRELFALTPINAEPRALVILFNNYLLSIMWQLIRYSNRRNTRSNQIHDALLTDVRCNDRRGTPTKQSVDLFRKKGPVGSCVVVVDCAGFHLHRYLFKPFLVAVKSVVKLDVQHYPELLHHAYIINCRARVSFPYLLIRHLLGLETREKVTFCSRQNSTSTLLEVVGSDLLPQELGGKCHCTGGCIPSVPTDLPRTNPSSPLQCLGGHYRSSSTTSLQSKSSSTEQACDYLDDEPALQRLNCTVERLNLLPHSSKILSFAMDVHTEIIWEFVTKHKRKVTFSAVFVSAADDGMMLSLVPRTRVQNDAGHYICPSFGTVIFRWSNKGSFFHRCRINLKVYQEEDAGSFAHV